MPIVLLVRHGENEYIREGRLAGRLPGVHLNERGRAQSQTLAERMAGEPIKAVYSSPLERALETAEPIAKALGFEVSPCPSLIETDYGEWQDRKLEELSRLNLWRSVQQTPSLVQFPGGESFVDCQERIRQGIEGLCAQHDPKATIVCVSHADPIKLAVAYFIGLPLDSFQHLNVNPASITALHLDSAGNQLLTLNSEAGS